MNKSIQSIIFYFAIVGGASADPLGSVDAPTAASPMDTVDASVQEASVQMDMDSALRSQTKVKVAPSSQSDGDRIGDLEAEGEVAAGFLDFIKCWAEHDFEGSSGTNTESLPGGSYTITHGCWDQHMGRAGEGNGGSDSKSRARSAKV